MRILPPLEDSNSITHSAPPPHAARSVRRMPASAASFPRPRSSAEPLLQPHIVQPQRVRNRIHTVLPRQFHRRLPQRLRQLRPPRLRAPKLIQLVLQLRDWFGNGVCFCGLNLSRPRRLIELNKAS